MRRGRRGDDSGAVIVEFALVASLIVSILFGLIEFGFAWETRLATQNASRAGARVASSLGDERDADYNALRSVASALEGVGLGNVEYVMIYKPVDASGTPHPNCTGTPLTSSPGRCNVYTGNQLVTLAANETLFQGSCGSALDGEWCPTNRQVIQALGPDYLGVYIRLKHDFITGVFGNEMTITDRSVMRLEPGG
ncbi:MAG: pilus assembly protein [Acidimicrobiia bacterium]|nr:pilus assembly protein [Acidimicrobiia bacterium]